MNDNDKEIKRIKRIILEQIQSNFDFVRHDDIPEIEVSASEVTGLLWRRFRLSDVRIWCELSEAHDDLLLSALDDLAKKGKLKFFSIRLTKEMNINDIGFACELGKGTRTLGFVNVKLTVSRFYSKEPLKKKERDEHTILNVKERVEQIRAKRNEYFAQRFGKIDFDLERKLHRAGLIKEARYRNAALTVPQDIKKKRKEKFED